MTQMNEAPDSSRGGAEALARLQEQEARSSRRFGLCFQFCPTSFSGDPSKPRLKQHRAVVSYSRMAFGVGSLFRIAQLAHLQYEKHVWVTAFGGFFL